MSYNLITKASQMTKKEVITHFGGVGKTAKALSISHASISQWKEVPMLRQFQIEQLTNGELKRAA